MNGGAQIRGHTSPVRLAGRFYWDTIMLGLKGDARISKVANDSYYQFLFFFQSRCYWCCCDFCFGSVLIAQHIFCLV